MCEQKYAEKRMTTKKKKKKKLNLFATEMHKLIVAGLLESVQWQVQAVVLDFESHA